MGSLTLAVIGHVEHVTLGFVPAVPLRAEIAHLDGIVTIAGGGGGVAYMQLAKSPADVHLFSALGHDAAASEVEAQLRATRGHLHLAHRAAPHTRDVVMLTPDGERTIVVLGEPLHPRHGDALPWDLLAGCDAVYFTAQDPELLKAARAARRLVVTARRRAALVASGVRADVVVGSAHDGREASALADYPVAPEYLVMTEGLAGGRVESATEVVRFARGRTPAAVRSSYGAGDSFAGALVYYLAAGMPVVAACAEAAHHGAAVLASADTLAAQLPLGSVSGPPARPDGP
jgi:ribokinase